MREQMVIIQKSFISNTLFSNQTVNKNGRKFGTTLAKKRNLSENSSTTQQQQPPITLKVSNTILARSIIAVLGLGFVDAGYSGDWSRIGVISKESEDLLKVAAFIVVPLCLFLIFSISKDQEA